MGKPALLIARARGLCRTLRQPAMKTPAVVLSLLLAGLALPKPSESKTVSTDLPGKDTTLQGDQPQEETEEQKRVRAKFRLKQARDDFDRMRLVDSVGWLKMKAVKRPDESMDQLEREQAQRKVAALRNFCQEIHFEKLAEVDSIQGMNADERRFCKDRLNLVNPLLQ